MAGGRSRIAYDWYQSRHISSARHAAKRQIAVCEFNGGWSIGATRCTSAALHGRSPANEMNDSSVRELARRAGVAVQWTDRLGKRHRVSLDTIRRIMAALQLPCQTADDIKHSRRALDNTTIPPLITATLGRAIDVPWRRPNAPARAHLIRDDGTATDVPVHRTSRGIRLQAVKAIGYHTLEIGQARLTLAVAPAQCVGIADIAGRERVAGVAAQIYALRNAGDCGIGDMS